MLQLCIGREPVKIHVVVFRIVTPRSDVVGYDPKAMVE
jgi:hypothetical protein